MSCIHPEVEDWEDLLNLMMKYAFSWGDHQMKESARDMLHRGQYGLDGFVNFIKYFVTRHDLMGGLIETKLEAVLEALESACMTPTWRSERMKQTHKTHADIHTQVHPIL